MFREKLKNILRIDKNLVNPSFSRWRSLSIGESLERMSICADEIQGEKLTTIVRRSRAFPVAGNAATCLPMQTHGWERIASLRMEVLSVSFCQWPGEIWL